MDKKNTGVALVFVLVGSHVKFCACNDNFAEPDGFDFFILYFGGRVTLFGGAVGEKRSASGESRLAFSA